MRKTKAVILGVGNILRGDDGVGCEIAQELLQKNIPGFVVIDAGTVPEDYLNKIIELKPEKIIIVDATDMGSAPGDFKVISEEHLNSFSFHTHALSPVLLIQYLRAHLKAEIYFVAIQPLNTAFGQSLSPEVSSRIKEIVEFIIVLAN